MKIETWGGAMSRPRVACVSRSGAELAREALLETLRAVEHDGLTIDDLADLYPEWSRRSIWSRLRELEARGEITRESGLLLARRAA